MLNKEMGFQGFQRNFRVFLFSVKMALRSMRFRSFRTFLTVLGISIGIMTFVALMSIGVGMEIQITALIHQFMGAGMMVSSDSGGGGMMMSRPNVPDTIGPYLEQIDGINESIGVIEDFVDVSGNMLRLAGAPAAQFESAFGVVVVEGHTLDWAIANGISNPLIIDEAAQTATGYGVNDTIIVSSMISGAFMEFEIVGISSSFQIDMSFFMAGFAYTDLEIFQDLLVTDSVSYFMIGLEENVDTDAISDAIKAAFPDASVITSEEVVAMSNQIMDMMFAVLFAIGSISLLVGALMITNSTMMSVLERTREIGIIKSIGGKRSHVLMIFITESIFIALIGGIAGCLFSLVAVEAMTGLVKGMYGFPLAYRWEAWIFGVGLGLAAGIGAIAGAFPSWRAASVKPVEALTYE